MSEPAAVYQVATDAAALRDPRPAHEQGLCIDRCWRCGVVDHHLVDDLCSSCWLSTDSITVRVPQR